MADAELGVFGGSGFYSFLDDVESVAIDTPFGAPSDRIAIGTVADRRVAFIPRHGAAHTIPPARIPQRANLWAMRSLGVRSVVGPCAVGSLRPDIEPGSFVVLDQLVDRTRGRDDTYYDGDTVHHVSFEMRGIDEYMRGTGRVMRAGIKKIWGPGRHLAGNNTFSYFLDPSGNTMEYTTELERLETDQWHPTLYDIADPDTQDQWGTADPMSEIIAKDSFNDPDRGIRQARKAPVRQPHQPT